ncbi:MAG: RtcB family protein, partial [Streptosporangiaceae bacterium]
MGIIAESEYRFVIPGHGRMRVPGVVFATRALIPAPAGDRALEQVVNVAELPGIVAASYAMPDVHWGYGFPIGGVAATDVARGGAVSPGGVGFDICCGVRLLVASISGGELVPVLGQVMDRIAAAVPCGNFGLAAPSRSCRPSGLRDRLVFPDWPVVGSGQARSCLVQVVGGLVEVVVAALQPGLAPEEVAAGLGAQDPPVGFLEQPVHAGVADSDADGVAAGGVDG